MKTFLHKDNSLQKNTLMNLVLTFSSVLFPMLSYKYASNILFPSGIGKVSFAVSLVTYFKMLAQLGIPTYGIREAAKLRDSKEKLSLLIRELTLISLITSAVSYLLLFIVVSLFPSLTAEKSLYFALSPMILMNAIGLEWLYKGLEQYSYLAFRSLICYFLSFLGVVLLVHDESDYVLYAALTILAPSLAYLWNLISTKKLLFSKSSFSRDKYKLNLRQHIKPIIIFFATTCAITAYTNLDTFMLGVMTNDTIVGYYDVTVKIKYVLSLIVTALGSVLLPRASYYLKREKSDAYQKLLKTNIRFVFISALPLIIIVFLFTKKLIFMISGPAYEAAILPTRIILPSVLFIGLTNVIGMQILVPHNREKDVFHSVLIGAFVDLVLNLILIPSYGAAGAALGTSGAEFAVLSVQLYKLKKASINNPL